MASAEVEHARQDPRAARPPRRRTTPRAGLPTSLDDETPDEDEVLARGLLGGQLIAWLAEEDDPDAAQIWAEQIAEVAPWLRPDDRARLADMARADPLEARRQAALVALGRR